MKGSPFVSFRQTTIEFRTCASSLICHKQNAGLSSSTAGADLLGLAADSLGAGCEAEAIRAKSVATRRSHLSLVTGSARNAPQSHQWVTRGWPESYFARLPRPFCFLVTRFAVRLVRGSPSWGPSATGSKGFSSSVLSRSAIRTKSAGERAPIFCMIWLR
jgi:hypothetical protein